MQREIYLLDHGGSTDKNVDHRIKENHSGIDLKGFVLTAGEMLEITGESIRDETIEFTVERVIQYKPWNFGTYTPGNIRAKGEQWEDLLCHDQRLQGIRR